MIKLALPSKGRLMLKSFDWFKARGITLSKIGHEREYAGEVDGFDGLTLQFLAASEIPDALASGRVHLGITGRDLIREKLALWEQKIEELAALGFGHADLIIAVPSSWIDVDTLDDLDAVAAQFRAEHGHRLRIATKYHRLVREALREAGVADYTLIDSQGATEGAVRHEAAEAIADITSTGETLRANDLKILADGPLLRSEAVLARSRAAPLEGTNRARMEELRRQLGTDDW